MELKSLTKKRFVSDFGLPIDILEEPYFSQKIALFNEEFDTVKKLNLLFKSIEKYGSENEFFQESNRVIREMQDFIKDKTSYQHLSDNRLEDMSKYINETKSKLPITKNLYIEPNIDSVYVSIDLKEANFNVFKNAEILLEFSNYSDFVSRFTDDEYFKFSKNIRQVVFGSLLPKKQVLMEEYEICKILNSLNIENYENGFRLGKFEVDRFILNKDELIFRVSKDFDISLVDKLIFSDFPLRIEKFKLEGLRDKKDKLFFVKNFGNRKELKGVPKNIYAQAYKKMLGLEITDEDLVFFFEGKPAKFLDASF